MYIPNMAEIFGVLVSFAIIFFVIRWFHKAYQKREKNENLEKKQIPDEDWIGETDEDWSKINTIEEEKKRLRQIPSRLKRHVWRRDKGRCVQCGSKKNLEYDHIIPLSEGGSNTVGNIKLLCKECNRRESNKI